MTDLEYIIMLIGFGVWFYVGYTIAKNKYYKKVEYPKYIDFDIIAPTLEELNSPEYWENQEKERLKFKIDCSNETD